VNVGINVLSIDRPGWGLGRHGKTSSSFPWILASYKMHGSASEDKLKDTDLTTGADPDQLVYDWCSAITFPDGHERFVKT